MAIQTQPDRDIRFTAKERDFVFGVAMRYMKDEEDASDAAQEVFLGLFLGRGTFAG